MSVKPADLEEIEKFWSDNPLFTGEADLDLENPESFFSEHDIVYFDDVLCGIGFWSNQSASRYKVSDITSADLTDTALKICGLRVPNAKLRKENAEQLSFANGEFSFVNCQGVIHHTPETQACFNEIYRVLKKDGRASVSVYYKNSLLNFAGFALPLVKFMAKFMLNEKRRGRDFSKVESVDDIVRFFDGNENPLGKAYSRKEFQLMAKNAGFKTFETEFFFFPFRFFKFKFPNFLRRVLVYFFPFMTVLNLKK